MEDFIFKCLCRCFDCYERYVQWKRRCLASIRRIIKWMTTKKEKWTEAQIRVAADFGTTPEELFDPKLRPAAGQVTIDQRMEKFRKLSLEEAEAFYETVQKNNPTRTDWSFRAYWDQLSMLDKQILAKDLVQQYDYTNGFCILPYLPDVTMFSAHQADGWGPRFLFC